MEQLEPPYAIFLIEKMEGREADTPQTSRQSSDVIVLFLFCLYIRLLFLPCQIDTIFHRDPLVISIYENVMQCK